MSCIEFSGGKKRQELIDFGKTISILAIVFYHLIYGFCNMMPNVVVKASFLGGAGVHFFIFASGFGLYSSYLKNNIRFVDFIKKRMLKVYFPYMVVVSVSVLVPYMYNGDNRFLAYLGHLFLFKMFNNDIMNSFGGHFWFISTIIQFYIVFILLCYFKKKMGGHLFLVLSIILSFIFWTVSYVLDLDGNLCIHYCFISYLWEFCLGMCIAEKFSKSEFRVKIPLWILVLVSVVGISVLGYSGVSGGVLKAYNDLFSFFGFTALIMLLYYFVNKSHVLTKAWKWLSPATFELYLIHILVFTTIFHFFAPDSWILQFVIGIIGVIISVVLSKMMSSFSGHISRIIRREKEK